MRRACRRGGSPRPSRPASPLPRARPRPRAPPRARPPRGASGAGGAGHGGAYFGAGALRRAPIVKEHSLGFVGAASPALLPRYEWRLRWHLRAARLPDAPRRAPQPPARPLWLPRGRDAQAGPRAWRIEFGNPRVSGPKYSARTPNVRASSGARDSTSVVFAPFTGPNLRSRP